MLLNRRPPSRSTPSASQAAALAALGLTALTTLAWCALRKPAIPAGVHPVEDLDLERYQGSWYEVARIDHRFERGHALQRNHRIQ